VERPRVFIPEYPRSFLEYPVVFESAHSARLQRAEAACAGSAVTTPTPEQLRGTLVKTTVPDLIEKCKAAGISGYSNKRREELIDLLVRKKPRLGEQVHFPGIGRLRSARHSALRSVPRGLYCAASAQGRS
jgi:hypothetical protein